MILFPEFDQDLEQVDWENLIVTLLMTSFFVIKNELQHFTKLTALEKLNLRLWCGVGVCSKVKSLVMCDVAQKTFKLSFREKVNKRSVHPSSSLFRNASLLENVNIAPFYQH